MDLTSLSPTAECTAEQAFKYVGPHIVFASGSPFQDVDLGMILYKLFSFTFTDLLYLVRPGVKLQI